MTHDDEQSHIGRAAAALGDPDARRDAHQDHAPDRIWLRYDGVIVAGDYPRPWETHPYVRADLIRAVDPLREALEDLEKVAPEVIRYGAQTGSQLTRLTAASLRARATLAAMDTPKGGGNE